MSNKNKRPRINTKIYAYNIKLDTYTVVVPPFHAEEHLVYIRAANEKEARQKIHDKYNQFLVSKALKERK